MTKYFFISAALIMTAIMSHGQSFSIDQPGPDTILWETSPGWKWCGESRVTLPSSGWLEFDFTDQSITTNRLDSIRVTMMSESGNYSVNVWPRNNTNYYLFPGIIWPTTICYFNFEAYYQCDSLNAMFGNSYQFEFWAQYNQNNMDDSLVQTPLILPKECAVMSAHEPIRNESRFLTIFPNPCMDYFSIRVDKKVDVKIYDINGRLLFDQLDVSDGSEFVTTSWPSGTYHITAISSDGWRGSATIVKME